MSLLRGVASLSEYCGEAQWYLEELHLVSSQARSKQDVFRLSKVLAILLLRSIYYYKIIILTRTFHSTIWDTLTTNTARLTIRSTLHHSVKVKRDVAKSIMEAYITSKELNYTKCANGSIIIPFKDSNITFLAAEQETIVALKATLDSKVSDRGQMTVACQYAAKVNFGLTIGSVQFDMRDGEIMFYHAVPLEGMSVTDARMLIKSW